jgi:transcriptional regulator with XRE-family HTH domain
MSNMGKLYYKTCREQSGLTQEHAIALLGIAEVATLSRYENGRASVRRKWKN